MTIRVGVTGAAGRMGGQVLSAIEDRGDCELAFAVNRAPTADRNGETEIEAAAEFPLLLDERDPGVVVDFSGSESALEYARACAEAGVPFVTGTTGFDEDERDRLRAASEDVAVLHSPNFARGVQVLDRLVEEVVRKLPGYDVELIETHHNAKRDAPSGTANGLLSTIEDAGAFEGRTHGRAGDAPRETGEIGVHAIRAGNVTGQHEVLVAGDYEELRLTHRVEDRGVFAAGALDAAVWLVGRDPGWYEFAEVIES